ncbi:MAG: bifunctional 5,10-methylenetetrahydrofolate dehydrogenase/5,10-methenyltetrahydrofolate cyclohydrolase [Rickettsiales bacterium]|jgi:methylenetetrahydrofolate dehydrogenase (NADP+)/methenyltetrahydrofolate cyclohydrolase|nr:bifunctional 5,10-methylenetetrahydrofolate dehydrogenase/5,10-methenyltetrahydrofolate cyclohydrolase [Rickettsiales bacterium]
MAEILDGRALASEMTKVLAAEVSGLRAKACLKVILVGNDPASLLYDNMKVRKARELGIDSDLVRLPGDASEEELVDIVGGFNKDPCVHGILVQMPLPGHIDEGVVCGAVAPWKDVDGFHPLNKGLVSMGDESMMAPCTPLGIIRLLEHYGIAFKGARAVVIGSSNIVGKPMSHLLTNRGATVTLCNDNTRGLGSVSREADIIVSAAGKEGLVSASMIRDGAVVVDVAMVHRKSDGRLCGDVDFEEAFRKASFITPVPGGVGPMTIITLMSNVIKAYRLQNGE